MKTFLFVNPTSGHHSAKRLQTTLKLLRSSSVNPEVFEVCTPAEIYSCCAQINTASEHPLVIVAGGDGTINAVVNGLEPGSANLAVLPFGTSNVFAAEIGIKSIEDAIAKIATGKTKSLSVGVIKFQERSLRFLLMAGIGLDGAVVRDIWPLGKKVLRQGAYALSALGKVINWDKNTFTLISSHGETACHTAIICNASRYGGDFILSPHSSPFSAGLTAVCIAGSDRKTYLLSAIDLFSRKAENSVRMSRIASSQFEITGNMPIQIDGDFVGYAPACISELPDFSKIIV